MTIGTPAEILRAPADDYVRAFFRGVDASRVLRARDIARPPDDGLLQAGLEPVAADTPIHALLGRVAAAPGPLPVVEADGRLIGVISRAVLLEALDRGEGAGRGGRHG